MTTHDEHDPVNRWATEHYGFEDDPDHGRTDAGVLPTQTPTPVSPTPVSPAPRSPARVAARPRRGTALIASGVLGLVLLGGVGGVAAAAADAGPGDGPRGPDRAAVVQVDDNAVGRAGGPGGGRR